MNIKVKLFATLRRGRRKEVGLELAAGAAVRQVMEALNIPEEDVAILLVNGRDATLTESLAEGDTVSIFPPVGGG